MKSVSAYVGQCSVLGGMVYISCLLVYFTDVSMVEAIFWGSLLYPVQFLGGLVGIFRYKQDFDKALQKIVNSKRSGVRNG